MPIKISISYSSNIIVKFCQRCWQTDGKKHQKICTPIFKRLKATYLRHLCQMTKVLNNISDTVGLISKISFPLSYPLLPFKTILIYSLVFDKCQLQCKIYVFTHFYAPWTLIITEHFSLCVINFYVSTTLLIMFGAHHLGTHQCKWLWSYLFR